MKVTNDIYHFILEMPRTDYALLGKTWKPTDQWTEKEREDGFHNEESIFELCSQITWEDLKWQTYDSIWVIDIEIDKTETAYTLESITAYLTAIEEWLKTNPTITADRESWVVNQSGNENYYDPKRCFGNIYAPDNIRQLLVKKTIKEKQ